jgi:glutaconate CoA-transferase subunit B
VSYTTTELVTVLTARTIDDGSRVLAGVGVPLVASLLAKRRHAPNLEIIVEGGVVDPLVLPGYLPVSTNEMRIARGATMLSAITDTFLLAQRGFIDRGIIGAAQVDRFGNVNTSVIGHGEQPSVRLPGSGGANDIASLCGRVTVVTTHERRRFVERVDFITSPGWLQGGATRAHAGLIFGGVAEVITDLCLIEFDPVNKDPIVASIHPGSTVDQIRELTGFDLRVAEQLHYSVAPAEDELAELRHLIGTPRA